MTTKDGNKKKKRKKKPPMLGGPERHKVCSMCDGVPTRKFKVHWRTMRRLARAPQRKEWEDLSS